MALVLSGANKKAKSQEGGNKALLEPRIVQNFIHLYIENKMKTDKFTLQVGPEIPQFLASLDKPLQLNEMRVMKEANYARFRELLSGPALAHGDPLLGLLRDQAKALGGLSRKAFDLVYEGFWDLYCKKPANPAEMPVKKLEGFIQRVKLNAPAQPA